MNGSFYDINFQAPNTFINLQAQMDLRFSCGNNDFLWFLEFLIARENFDVMQQNWLSNMSTKFYKPLLLIEVGNYPTQPVASTTDKSHRTQKGSQVRISVWDGICRKNTSEMQLFVVFPNYYCDECR